MPSRHVRAARAFAWIGAAVAALGAAACETTHNCRSGTLFLEVDLGQFKNVDEVDVSVSIAGGDPMKTSLPIAAGAKTGGIEIDFPHGYPAGAAVSIGVEAKVAGTTVAVHSTTIYAMQGCQVVDTTFYADDAVTGTGGAGGSSAGAGGRGGVAGTSAAGTSGAAGMAGTSAGGTGGPGGTGGSTGGSIGGGIGGGGGSLAGSGGTGGIAGTTGGSGGALAGRGGGGGAGGGTGGTGGACVPQPENCFNGADDDCDGQPDCADPDCVATAQCVPLDFKGGRLGVVVTGGTACPSGFNDLTGIYMGLTGGACTGCSCRPPTVTSCSATISSYGSATDCANAANGGTPELTLTSTMTCTTPSWTGSSLGQVYGIQAGTFTPTLSGSCLPSGVASPGPSGWMTSNRFCAAPTVGYCPGGQACVPLTSSPKCTMFDGSSHICQAGTIGTVYYTNYTDTRTCGSCSCGGPVGQGCSAMRITAGTDYTCSPNVTATLSSGQRFCYSGSGVYSPGVVFTGTPTQPTSCPASSPLTGGALTQMNPKTVCCM